MYKYKKTMKEDQFCTGEYLIDHLDIKLGKYNPAQLSWLVFENEEKTLYIPNHSIITHISGKAIENMSLNDIDIDGKTFKVNNLTDELWRETIVSSVAKGEIAESFLNVNFIKSPGSGVWVRGELVKGYYGIKGEIVVDPLTCSKDYGWRPVLEIMRDVEI